MNDPKTARQGVAAGVAAMVLAVGGTMLTEIKSYEWILVAMVLGTIAGVPLSRVALTAVPATDSAVARVRRPGRRPGRPAK